MDLDVRGKAFILIGGSRGMGWEVARILAEDGADLAIISRNPASVAEAASALAARCGVRIETLAADVTAAGSVEAAISDAISRFGVVRGLAITNFSVSASRPLAEMDDAEWDYLYQDVLMGSVRACRAIIPHLAENGGGQIVLTGAYSARATKGFLAGYASFKAAIVSVTKNIAKTYGPQGIRANCVCPGFTETERTVARIDGLIASEGIDHAAAARILLERSGMKVGLDRIGKAHEVGDMIAFLLSERAAYTNGLIANVDGGTDF